MRPFCVTALGFMLHPSVVRAQILPLPPLPPPAFSVAPDPAADTAPSPQVTGAPPSTDATVLHASLYDPSAGARAALSRSREHETWYGWQTLAVDASAVAILLVGAALVTSRPPTLNATVVPRPVPFAVAALGVYAIGPPVLHLAHGEYRHGIASLALRVAMPLAGFGLGYLAGRAVQPGGSGSWTDGAYGAAVGGVGAIALDASGLAWQRWGGSGAPTALFTTSASF